MPAHALTRGWDCQKVVTPLVGGRELVWPRAEARQHQPAGRGMCEGMPGSKRASQNARIQAVMHQHLSAQGRTTAAVSCLQGLPAAQILSSAESPPCPACGRNLMGTERQREEFKKRVALETGIVASTAASCLEG